MSANSRWGRQLGFFSYGLVFFSLYFAYKSNYLLFHTMVEFFILAVSTSLFMLAWNARKIIKNNFLIFLSVVYFFVGVLNLFHILGFNGMPFFSSYNSSFSTQVWIAGRLMLSFSVPISFIYLNRKLNELLLFWIYLGITGLLLASILWWKNFPLTYSDGDLTGFKIGTEYLIIGMFGLSIYLLIRHKKKFDSKTYLFLILAMVFNIAAELLLTIFFIRYELLTAGVHILLLFSYYFVYKAIIEVGLITPYRLLFWEMEELNKRKDQLLYVASHELKNPLTNLQLYTRLLGDKIVTDSTGGENMKILDRIRSQTMRINRLISDLNDVGQIETGRLSMQMAEVDPIKMGKEIAGEWQKQQTERKITFKYQKKKYPKVWCDPLRIGQVLNNLISNACKYSPPESEVTIKAMAKKDCILFSVKDRDRGMDKEEMNLVFNKYHRGGAANAITGLGLGLYISKEIISRHQGHIWVESKPGVGSTFYFEIPGVIFKKSKKIERK